MEPIQHINQQFAVARRSVDAVARAVMPAQAWDALARDLDEVLSRPSANPAWLETVLALRSRARELAARDMDEALLQCLHGYPGHAGRGMGWQALRRMLVAGEAAFELGYGQWLMDHLDRAALTLNLSDELLLRRLTRLLAPRAGEPMAALTQRYADDAAVLMLDGAEPVPVWMEAVRQHRDTALDELPPWQLTTAQHLAALLRRVDRFCARAARTAGRLQLTTLQAMGSGEPAQAPNADPVGVALLKAVGLYPPGSLVLLASDEIGMVLRRGRRPDQPLVAVFADARDAVPLPPRLCDTAWQEHAVRAVLRVDQLPVQPPLQALRQLRPHRQAERAA